jgi:hypothetical protein
MLFDCPSPKGTNHAGLYLNSAGYLFDRRGGYWGKSQIKKMAMDQDLHHDRGETAEALLALRSDIEKCMEELDLHDEVKRELFECLNRHIRPGQHTKGGPGPKYFAGHGATDADEEGPHAAFERGKHLAEENPRPALRETDGFDDDDELAEFVRFLKQKGLDNEAIKEALKIVHGGGDTEDRFPTSGPLSLGGRMSDSYREHAHEPTFRGRHATSSNPHHGATDARSAALDSVRRIQPVAGERASPGRRLSKKERAQIAFDARSEKSFLERHPEMARLHKPLGRVW